MRRLIPALLLMALLLAGCATTGTAPVQHPGAINAVDSQLYDTLLTIQSGIEEAKVQFAANPSAKAPLNKVIASYNAAMDAYKTYHSAGAGDANTLTLQINSVKSDLAALAQLFGGKE